jgi:hypothetical protein
VQHADHLAPRTGHQSHVGRALGSCQDTPDRTGPFPTPQLFQGAGSGWVGHGAKCTPASR